MIKKRHNSITEAHSHQPIFGEGFDKYMNIKWFSLVFILVLSMTLWDISPVIADVAPPPPPFGSNPFISSTNTQVQMVSEVVTFDVGSASASKYGFAKVNATFQMHNQGSQDEKMMARFPLCAFYDAECIWSPEPSIDDLAVWVNGVWTPVTIVTTTFPGVAQAATPAWGNFSVTFPAGKDVVIKVSYTALGFSPDIQSGFVEYKYILQTGAGWNGPIGRADFNFHLPYAINQKNVTPYSPKNSWEITGNDLHWHAENFKPDQDIQINLVNPSIWQTILTETKNTQIDQNNGAAWGRLGKAYRDTVWERRSVQNDPGSLERIKLSEEAYQNAIRVLPKDIDWHYGYAELLCYMAMWNTDDPARLTRSDPNLIGCIEQLKDTLAINPKDPRALSLLQAFAVPDLGYNKSGQWLIVATPGIVDFSNPQQPNYLILTPQPSATIEPTITLTSTPSPTETSTLATIILSSPTASVTTTNTKEPGQQVAQIEISPTLTLVPTSSNSIESYRVLELGGICVIVLGGLFGLFLLRRRHSA